MKPSFTDKMLKGTALKRLVWYAFILKLPVDRHTFVKGSIGKQFRSISTQSPNNARPETGMTAADARTGEFG
jgi:hypothetical protein